MGPSPHADPNATEKPEVIEHSNRKVSKVLLLVTTILVVAAICILLRDVQPFRFHVRSVGHPKLARTDLFHFRRLGRLQYQLEE